MQRTLFNFLLAMEGVSVNKLRSFLTALGIIFGVAAVIAMLAIGTGAKKAILDQMRLIGTNNIVITTKIPWKDAEGQQENNQESSSGNTGGSGNQEDKNKRPYSPGLTLEDLKSISRVVPTVEKISPEIVLPTSVVSDGKLVKGRCVGVTNEFFDLNRLPLGQGRLFHDVEVEGGHPVCIIGKNIQTKFFPQEDPIGRKIKCGNTWVTITGVLERRTASKESLASLGIRDYNDDVYLPVTTTLLRLKNRAAIAKGDIKRGDWDNEEVDDNYHQLDRVVIRIGDSRQLQASADIIARILKRRHLDIVDYEIEVPELLLEQQQKTQDTFNLVLAVIAGISLLVGGIGIMNIMLASVMERINEIGVRRALGAKQNDIILQFLFEAVAISLIGGLVGVLLGLGAAKTIAASSGIPTIVSAWSVVLSFGVAATVGLVFGIIPARRAAQQDPIKALRTE